jgi:uncharacterized Ntn-hydrolase superfamily protein
MRPALLTVLLLLAACGSPQRRDAGWPEVATFSIAARDPETGDLGVAVQSRFFGVGVVVPWVRADVGAVATQAMANPRYGPEGLDLLDDGVGAEEVVTRLTGADEGREARQLGVVDARGGAAAFTGKRTFRTAGHHVGEGYCCQGNILAGQGVLKAMAAAFEASEGALAERLVKALAAGQAAGGDRRGRQSAALLVARRHGGYLRANDRYVDIRVDDHPTPIAELGRLLALHRRTVPDAPVPRAVEGLRREPRHATPAGESARAVWLRCGRLRDAQDWPALLALTTKAYRESHDAASLARSQQDESLRRDARSAVYLGTRVDERHAKLYFDDPRRDEPLVVTLVREGDRWRFVP